MATKGTDSAGFRPEFWPTLFTIPALCVMVALGIWQLQRLEWKEALIAKVEARMHDPAISLPTDLSDVAGLEFRHVFVTGTFLHDKEIYLGGRYYNGVLGHEVLTPFRLADGRLVLVNRGWVPHKRRDPETRAEGQVGGVTSLHAVIRAPQASKFFTPANDAAKNYWFWVDLDAIRSVTGEPLLPVYLEAVDTENPGGLPKAGESSVRLLNDHLHYAITWFSLAGTLAVVYVLYHRRRAARR